MHLDVSRKGICIVSGTAFGDIIITFNLVYSSEYSSKLVSANGNIYIYLFSQNFIL